MALTAESYSSPLAQEIIKSAKERARDFADQLDRYSPRDKEAFSVILSTCGNHGITQARLAELFSTTPGTISRWSNGKSVPPQYSRASIVSRIRNLVLSELAG